MILPILIVKDVFYMSNLTVNGFSSVDNNKNSGFIMSPEQQRLSDKILRYFKSSYSFKQESGLFSLWDKIEKYWDGSIRQSQNPSSPSSNINFIHSNIEAQVALMLEQDISINVNPCSPYEIPFCEHAETILNFIKNKNRLRRVLDIHERQREKFGTGIFRVLFDPYENNGLGLPLIDVCSPLDIFPDPSVTDVRKFQNGGFIIETFIKPIDWAKKHFGGAADFIKPNYHPLNNYSCFPPDPQSDGQHYLHLLAFIKSGGVLRAVQMSGCGIILYDSFSFGDGVAFYKNNMFPYFFTPLYSREKSFWAKGDAEILIPLQDLVDDMDDQLRINARLNGNPQRLVDISSNIDVDKWTNESGLIIPTSNIDGAKYLVPPEVPSYIIQRRESALKYERQILTRFSDQMLGQSSSSSKTATESLELLRQGNVIISHKKMMLQETLSDLFSYCFELAKEFYTEETSFSAGDKCRFVNINPSSLAEVPYVPDTNSSDFLSQSFNMNNTPFRKEAHFDIKVSIGTSISQQTKFQFTILQEMFEKGVISSDEFKLWIVQNLDINI